MTLDIRLPIGLMFTLFGLILIVFGLVSDPADYQRSMNINVNLWWGAVMAIFGAVMLCLAWLGKRARGSDSREKDPGTSKTP